MTSSRKYKPRGIISFQDFELYEVTKNTMVNFLYQHKMDKLSYELLEPARFDHIYSIQFIFPRRISIKEKHEFLDNVEEFFNDNISDHTFFYMTTNNNGYVVFMEASEPIDEVLFKLTMDCQILQKFSKEEFNKDVEEINSQRKSREIQEEILNNYAKN